MEPEILLVDEVLAVGDIEFQKKCLGKMGNVAKEGRTVLLVSHNMGAIQRLCSRSILLSAGQIISDGSSRNVVDYYLNKHVDSSLRLVTFDSKPKQSIYLSQVALLVKGSTKSKEIDISTASFE